MKVTRNQHTQAAVTPAAQTTVQATQKAAAAAPVQKAAPAAQFDAKAGTAVPSSATGGAHGASSKQSPLQTRLQALTAPVIARPAMQLKGDVSFVGEDAFLKNSEGTRYRIVANSPEAKQGLAALQGFGGGRQGVELQGHADLVETGSQVNDEDMVFYATGVVAGPAVVQPPVTRALTQVKGDISFFGSDPFIKDAEGIKYRIVADSPQVKDGLAALEGFGGSRSGVQALGRADIPEMGAQVNDEDMVLYTTQLDFGPAVVAPRE